MTYRAIDLDMVVGFLKFVGDAGKRDLSERPDRVAAVSIKTVTVVRPCRTIFQNRPKIFVYVIDKKDNLCIDSIEIWKYNIRFRDDVDNIFIILTQKISENFAGFEVFIFVSDDPAIPVMSHQVSVTRAFSCSAGERLDRGSRQRYPP